MVTSVFAVDSSSIDVIASMTVFDGSVFCVGVAVSSGDWASYAG